MSNELTIWCNLFLSKPRRVLHGLDHFLLFRLKMADEQVGFGNSIPKELIEDVQQSFSYKVLDKRSKAIGLTLTEPVKLFLSFLCTSPGEIVMYLYVLRNVGRHHSMSSIDKLFKDGFPTPEALSESWSAQKKSGLNMLDFVTVDCFEN